MDTDADRSNVLDVTDRYARQIVLPDFGARGQAMLSRSHVAIIGVGALGCATADLLARAGVGRITLIDRDLVDRTNLQRQCLFTEQDALESRPKAQAAAARLRAVNSQIEIVPVSADLTGANAQRVLRLEAGGGSRPHVLVDGTDNFETRFLLNDLSVEHSIPFAYGGVLGTRGMQATLVPGRVEPRMPCLRCLFEEIPAPGSSPTCDTAGVFGAAVSIVAGAQAADVLKLLIAREDLVSGYLLDFDVWTNHRRRIDLRGMRPRPDCVCCGLRRFEYLDARAGEAASLCGQDAVQVSPGGSGDLDLGALAARLRPVGEVTVSPFMVRVRPRGGHDRPLEITVFSDARAIIRGTRDLATARSAYARYVGI